MKDLKTNRKRSACCAERLERRRLLAASLIKDIDTAPASNDPQGLTSAGSAAYFTFTDGVNGYEPWKTDGTTAGTTLLRDINPGGAPSFAAYFTRVGSTIFFSADDGTVGSELWKTDGTTAGTVRVADINPGVGSSNPTSLTAVGSTLFFFADDGVNGRELWKSDGTAAGTQLVLNLRPGSAGQTTFPPAVNLNGSLLFGGNNGTSGALYKSDGTAAGTTVLIASGTGSFLGSVGKITTSGTRAYFTDLSGYLFTTDGTTAGTVVIDNTNNSVLDWADVSGTLYYTRGSGGFSTTPQPGTLYKTTGGARTAITGTFNNSYYLAASGGALYFAASGTVSGGEELYRTTPASSSAAIVKDIVSGFNSSFPRALRDVNGTLFFTTGDTTNGYTLYKSDGTAANTVAVKSLVTGPTTFDPVKSAVAVGSRYAFVCPSTTIGYEVWASDGTAANTGVLKDIYPGTEGSLPYIFNARLGGYVFMQAREPTMGNELYKTDGTPGGTVLVKDIDPGPNYSNPSSLTEALGKIVFIATTAAAGTELWSTDGTSAGTVLVKDINPGSDGSYPGGLTEMNGWLYFVANDGTSGAELWRTDGTAANTQRVIDLYPGSNDGVSGSPVRMGNYLYFNGTTGSGTGNELWRTDGTAAGTALVKDINTGSASSSPGSFAAIGGTLYFTASGPGSTGVEPWKSDGTAAGTVLVKDIRPGSGDSSPSGFTLYNGEVYFGANDGTNGAELWKTDGTPAGTVLVKDVRSGSSGSSPSRFTVLNGALLFFAADAVGEPTLWATRGSAATTAMVADFSPGATQTTYLVSQGTTVAGGRMFFYVQDSRYGEEMWSSDGTILGTGLVQDLYPGSLGQVGFPVAFGSDILAPADNGVTGLELYRYSDTFGPVVTAARISAAAGGATQLKMTFNENVQSSLAASDVVVTDIATNTNASGLQLAGYDLSTNTATFTFAGYPGGVLPSGAYEVRFTSVNAVSDAAGNTIQFNDWFDFIWVSGTASADSARVVYDSAHTEWDVYVNGSATPSFRDDAGDCKSIAFSGLGGDDTFVIDLNGNAVLPRDGISIDGGTGTDVLLVSGAPNTSDAVTFRPGLFSLAGARDAEHVNVESIRFDGRGGADSVYVAGGAAVAFPVTQRLSSLTLGAGATASVLSGGDKVLVVSQSLSLDASAVLDLNDNDLILDYSGSSPLAAIQQFIGSARANGSWTGAGITSAAARNNPQHNSTIGLMEASEYKALLNNPNATFDGEPIDSTAVLVKYTYYGDANFDGRITFDDYVRIDTGFNAHRTGWTNGDFNLDGTVNFDDYVLIDIAFNTQGAPLSRQVGARIAR